MLKFADCLALMEAEILSLRDCHASLAMTKVVRNDRLQRTAGSRLLIQNLITAVIRIFLFLVQSEFLHYRQIVE